jgi:hypothetical protein
MPWLAAQELLEIALGVAMTTRLKRFHGPGEQSQI